MKDGAEPGGRTVLVAMTPDVSLPAAAIGLGRDCAIAAQVVLVNLGLRCAGLPRPHSSSSAPQSVCGDRRPSARSSAATPAHGCTSSQQVRQGVMDATLQRDDSSTRAAGAVPVVRPCADAAGALQPQSLQGRNSALFAVPCLSPRTSTTDLERRYGGIAQRPASRKCFSCSAPTRLDPMSREFPAEPEANRD